MPKETLALEKPVRRERLPELRGDEPYREQGERLQAARKLLKVSQRALADLAGTSLATIKGYERGARYPKPTFATKLSAAGINMAYVFSGDGPPLIPRPLTNNLRHAQAVERALASSARRADQYQLQSPGSWSTEGTNALLENSRSLVKMCRALNFEPPMVWTALLQELMLAHGLSNGGALRILETLKESAQ